MNTEAAKPRTYHQRARAAAAEANTERILAASTALFAARPFDQITLAEVAREAGVGLQTLIRRFRTKDDLARATTAWGQRHVSASRGEPTRPEPALVAAAVASQYEAFGAVIDRLLRQEEVSPALGEAAAAGRANHRAWIDATFAGALAAAAPSRRRDLRARLLGVTGIELWFVLRRAGGLSAAEAQSAVADLVAACLPPTTPTTPTPTER